MKLFHALRYSLTNEYLGWVLADISLLVAVELFLSSLCFRWPKRWVTRAVAIIAAIVCTWSVMNAGWLIRTGTQILPGVLLPLFRAPLSALCMIGVNLAKMPAAAFLLLGPSAVALAFFFFALARPAPPAYNRGRFMTRVVVCLTIILATLIARPPLTKRGSAQMASVGLRYNSQLRAVMSLVLREQKEQSEPKRQIPSFDELVVTHKADSIRWNVIVVVLEGIQYRYTSLADRQHGLTPYLSSVADEGVELSNARSCLSHTTKALFALLTGRFPSASQDIAEAVPSAKPYAGVATILRDELGYRTAFFQSAMGSFESRPGLVHNLGFEKFWARDDLADPNAFLGYLGSDEFSMLEPVSRWLSANDEPFFLTVLCSATHDPYEVPDWFGTPDKEPLERYRQAIFYTDKFLEALDVELANLSLVDNTILCIVGDHGEGFGEHGLLGHERNVFDEVLRIPFCLRAPLLLEPRTTVTRAVSSVDLAPTLLGLLGFETDPLGLDGQNVFACTSGQRKVYFCGWMQEGPAGFVEGERKYLYNPASKTVSVYDLRADPLELSRIELSPGSTREIADEIIGWRKNTFFRLRQQKTGKKLLYGRWQCRWTGRVSSAKYDK
ncbi:MAG: LTA synthase family protein [Phycisphaerales bacterium]|nr:MAG: LTA synthase family protein [Phycisphaerales bacterium]